MPKRIIYQNGTGISILVPEPSCGLTIEKIIKKDVPRGQPYIIVDTETILADRTLRDAWEFDFTNPTGYGGSDND